jgi:hypothetical protein
MVAISEARALRSQDGEIKRPAKSGLVITAEATKE